MKNNLNNLSERGLPGMEAGQIQELDQLLPRWWVWVFNASILFTVGYMLCQRVFNLGN